MANLETPNCEINCPIILKLDRQIGRLEKTLGSVMTLSSAMADREVWYPIARAGFLVEQIVPVLEANRSPKYVGLYKAFGGLLDVIDKDQEKFATPEEEQALMEDTETAIKIAQQELDLLDIQVEDLEAPDYRRSRDSLLQTADSIQKDIETEKACRLELLKNCQKGPTLRLKIGPIVYRCGSSIRLS